MRRAGWDGRGMVELFEILQRESRSDPGSVAVFFSSHPSPQDRISRLQATWPGTRAAREIREQFQTVKARLLRMARPARCPADNNAQGRRHRPTSCLRLAP